MRGSIHRRIDQRPQDSADTCSLILVVDEHWQMLLATDSNASPDWPAVLGRAAACPVLCYVFAEWN